MEPANVNKIFAGLCARSGVRRIRFHDLRHSCATLLYELGVPIENIQDVLGHSTPVITKLLYVDGTEKMQRTGWVHSSRAWTNDVGVRLGSSPARRPGMWPWRCVVLSAFDLVRGQLRAMDLYSHVMPTALREAADAIDRALGGPQ
jgi:hypothetical protein